jgi:hypothetical protein
LSLAERFLKEFDELPEEKKKEVIKLYRVFKNERKQ